MTTQTIFTTARDLRNWCWEHAGSNYDQDDVEKIVDGIRYHPDFPGWGRDCSNWLDSLDLWEFMAE